jgi:hypothetical protein
MPHVLLAAAPSAHGPDAVPLVLLSLPSSWSPRNWLEPWLNVSDNLQSWASWARVFCLRPSRL